MYEDLVWTLKDTYISPLLALRLTTKPLRRRNGLVVKRNANKSGVPRVLGWLGISYSALSDFPRALPPSPESATLTKHKAPGSIMPKIAIIVVARVMKPKARESNPGPHFC